MTTVICLLTWLNIFYFLWGSPYIQNVYQHRAEFFFTNAGAYFLNNLKRVTKEDFLPSSRDVALCEVRTTGISEGSFRIQDRYFQMFDTGGQRSERKKWIHLYEAHSHTAVVFVSDLSGYDEVLFEDDTVNRMKEDIEVFQMLTHNQHLKHVSLYFLVLNKRDFFAKKIKTAPLSKTFPEYKGANEYDEAIRFLRGKFLSDLPSSIQVPVFVTCALSDLCSYQLFDEMKRLLESKWDLKH